MDATILWTSDQLPSPEARGDVALPRLAQRNAPPRPDFLGMVRAELRKLRKQRATWTLAACFLLLFSAVAVLLLLAELPGSAPGRDPGRFLRDLTAITVESLDSVVGVFLLVGTARLVGMEYGGGTIRVLLAKGVGRHQLVAAKIAALALLGAALSLSGLVLAGAGALAMAGSSADGWHWLGAVSGADWRAIGQGVVSLVPSLATCILLPTAAAVVGRSTAFATGVALAYFPADFIASFLLGVLGHSTHNPVPIRAAHWLLGVNLNALPPSAVNAHVSMFNTGINVGVGHIALAVTGWCVLFLAVTIVFMRRDVTG